MSGLILFTVGTSPWITKFICHFEYERSSQPESEHFCYVRKKTLIVFVNDCEKRMKGGSKYSVWRPRIWVERIWKRMFSSCGLTSKHKCRKGVTNIACVIDPTGFQLVSNWIKVAFELIRITICILRYQIRFRATLRRRISPERSPCASDLVEFD